jgi:hypothetical protein
MDVAGEPRPVTLLTPAQVDAGVDAL